MLKVVTENQAEIHSRIGLAPLTKLAFDGEDLAPRSTELLLKLAKDPQDAGALMDLAVIEQLRGNLEAGLDYQNVALAQQQLYRIESDINPKLEVLVLAAPIRMGGNTPVEFLLAGQAVGLTTLYVIPGIPLPDPLPPHDVAFVAAPGDTDGAQVFLSEIAKHVEGWAQPVLNLPEHVKGLERDILWRTLKEVPGVVCPATLRCTRDELTVLTEVNKRPSDDFAMLSFPLLARPVGSHAGQGLVKLDGPQDVEAYLGLGEVEEYFVSQFIDYKSADGLYRKYRVVLIGGVPYPVHMAIADQWAIWYLNADMADSVDKRSEEAQFFTGFENEFARRHETALAALSDAVKLDYFGIDCAETEDGRLVVFEADNALIVHDMDPPDVFPYKGAPMGRAFRAFGNLLHTKADQAKAG
ncbi:MAG: hypothetical protein AAGI06_05375 [Pseudomonadota bacterium]